VDKTQRDKIEATIASSDALVNYARAMVPGPKNQVTLDNIKRVVRHAATSFVRDGMSPSAAVAKASGAFFGSFSYIDSPAGSGSTLRLTPDAAKLAPDIVKGTYAILNDPDVKVLDFNKLSSGKFDGTPAQYIDRLKTSGKWISSADGRGLFFTDEALSPVMQNGKRVFLTWAELVNIGRAASITGNTPWNKPMGTKKP